MRSRTFPRAEAAPRGDKDRDNFTPSGNAAWLVLRGPIGIGRGAHRPLLTGNGREARIRIFAWKKGLYLARVVVGRGRAQSGLVKLLG